MEIVSSMTTHITKELEYVVNLVSSILIQQIMCTNCLQRPYKHDNYVMLAEFGAS